MLYEGKIHMKGRARTSTYCFHANSTTAIAATFFTVYAITVGITLVYTSTSNITSDGRRASTWSVGYK
jgi:hypothetical protein